MSYDFFTQSRTAMLMEYRFSMQPRKKTVRKADTYARLVEHQIDHLHNLSRPGYLDGPADFGRPHAYGDDLRRIAWIGCGHESAYLGTRTYFKALGRLLKYVALQGWYEATGETTTYIDDPRYRPILTGLTA